MPDRKIAAYEFIRCHNRLGLFRQDAGHDKYIRRFKQRLVAGIQNRHRQGTNGIKGLRDLVNLVTSHFNRYLHPCNEFSPQVE